MEKIKSRTLLFFISVTLAFQMSCSKSEIPPPGNSNQTGSNDTVPLPSATVKGDTAFSGTWTGNIDVNDIHPVSCYYAGDPISVTQEWVVRSSGSVIVEETRIEYGDTTKYKFEWRGLMYDPDSVALLLSTPVTC